MMIKVATGGQEYVMSFEHTINGRYYFQNGVTIKANVEHPDGLAVRARTMCYIREAWDADKGGTMEGASIAGWGQAWCSVKDRFCKEIGRKVALERALKNGEFVEEERKEIWEAYFKRR